MNLSKLSSPGLHDAPGLLYAGFNQDQSCFAIGLNNGFRIYNCDPLIEHSRHESNEGGIGIVEMLYRTNYLALVGGGRNPRYAPNKVIIYDSKNLKPVVELEYKTEVRNVKLRKDRLTVVLSNKVYVYQFSMPPQLLHTFETSDNDSGLVAISSDHDHAILTLPGKQIGYVQIINLNTLSNNNNAVNVSIIHAHSNRISCLSLNPDGSRCATSSQKGTLIRVFDTGTCTLLHELRRGVDPAEIYSIAFNPVSTRLCVASDKGTIHLFNLAVSNRESSLSFMKQILPKYFSSQWSFANARLATESRCLVRCGESTLDAICADGGIYRFEFDPIEGGECTRVSFERFLKQ
ncbi:WD repeat domain phosphoinositide-interacting protein 3 [Rhizopus stolonifer]|uniref:WD repeat domain phosphoinositide-interacting protein 3 n=1 Tax=Rhizopus stolonifer TaxID=4846 RepID=A0A367IN57_RHIST|nr:WD repeat domain phosphoinositide-interacting protein 3 [Rhizopus stolonifer]